MYYGDEKTREMARSILPSTYRGAKKSANQTRRQHRRNRKQVLKKSIYDEDLLEELGCHDRQERLDLRYKRRDRQDSDKLRHFERWSIKVTDGLQPDERMAKMRAILPHNLVGWHARTHLRFIPEFRMGGESVYSEGSYPQCHPFEHRFREEGRDLVPELEEALKNPRVPALLQRWLHKNHSTCMWVLEYGVSQTKMEAKWITSNLGRYIRSKPHWEVKVRKTPVTLREEPRGPLRAPFVPRRADIQEFLDRLEEASSAPREIPSPPWEEQEARTLTEWVYKANLPEDYSPQGFRLHDVFRKSQKTRRNPEFHPEWKSSLVEFLDQYQGPDFYGFVRKNGIGKF